MKLDPARLLLAVDLAGTFLFGIEGALKAIGAGLDLLGILVLSFSTALAGGVVRDVLIGAVPPQSLRDYRYALTAFTAGVGTFLLYHAVRQVPQALIIGLDAAGLGLFAVAGTQKALAYRIPPFIAVLMGTITGVGGGTIRDVLLAQIPAVLHTDIYATAALAGSIVMIVGLKSGLRMQHAALVGGGACFVLRVVAVWQQWSLPKIG